MRRSHFNFDLPEQLIAQHPAAARSDSRLLCLDGNSGQLQDLHFPDILDLVKDNDLLVFNDTKVMPARLYAQKASGGKVEILVERILSEHRVLAQVKASKAPKIGTEIILDGKIIINVLGRQDTFFELRFEGTAPVIDILENFGHMPLPPYIRREDLSQDKERYQTVYATNIGAVAAPTAGLHFDNHLLNQLTAKGVKSAFVTLHVGAGTFQPMRVEYLDEHKMHSEYIEVPEQTCQLIKQTKKQGGRVIAVGTTTVRSLETASIKGEIEPFSGFTDIFLRPGSTFHCVDAMITNFHLPESTLLMLVCAFAGYDQVITAYRHAVLQKYRFFSYGDAMFLNRNLNI